ncbi:MAG TPA: 4Fe-4S binding protein, partial [Fibrobacteraceae bacterium]|nr:4Fe-4S binding protein [Fibrobacteraceae bacterium]
PEKCHACGACATQCRFDAIHPHAGVYQIDPLSCEGCKRCVQTCRFGAILWEERNCGTWLESSTRQGTLFHARLDPGAENSGKLVSLVREKARERAIQEKIPVILMDGPPGIGCPAIASLTGVHYALLVTEPTPAGHHDLMRILELVKHFQVHASLLLNKADLDDRYRQKIQEAMAENHVPIVGEIPFSPLFSEAQFHGQSIIEAFPDAEESQHLRAAIKNWLRIISESQHQRSIS